MSHVKITFYTIFILLAVMAVYISYETNHVEVVERTFSFSNLPEEFNGFRIVHISDIHAKEFGNQQKRLLKKLEGKKADLIALTGDYIDSQNPYEQKNISATIDLINGLRRMYPDAPVFYVKGNSESFDKVLLNEEMIKAGAIELDGGRNQPYIITRDRSSIMIGLPSYAYDKNQRAERAQTDPAISYDKFYIALTHYPYDFEVEGKMTQNREKGRTTIDADLFLAGHTHGGQIRLPIIGAVFGPTDGVYSNFLPAYSESVYSGNGRTMNVNKGLGTSGPWFARFRFLNPPEMSIVELRKA